MIRKLSFFLATGLSLLACNSNENNQDKISGTYFREYSFKIVHSERGDTIGIRTIRDTIFIRQKDQGYEVINHKWSLNDYDKGGWKNMDHAEDRPMPTYQADFNIGDSSLSAKEFITPLYLSPKAKQLFKSKSRLNPYYKEQ